MGAGHQLLGMGDNVKAIALAALPITPRFSPILIGRQECRDELRSGAPFSRAER